LKSHYSDDMMMTTTTMMMIATISCKHATLCVCHIMLHLGLLVIAVASSLRERLVSLVTFVL